MEKSQEEKKKKNRSKPWSRETEKLQGEKGEKNEIIVKWITIVNIPSVSLLKASAHVSSKQNLLFKWYNSIPNCMQVNYWAHLFDTLKYF